MNEWMNESYVDYLKAWVHCSAEQAIFVAKKISQANETVQFWMFTA